MCNKNKAVQDRSVTGVRKSDRNLKGISRAAQSSFLSLRLVPELLPSFLLLLPAAGPKLIACFLCGLYFGLLEDAWLRQTPPRIPEASFQCWSLGVLFVHIITE